MAETDLFQFYMKRFYLIPKDIKDDIIYCQRSFRAYLKVHQLVYDVFKKQGDADPVQKQRILDELEDDIEEINAEQQYLMLRLNDNLEKFIKLLGRNGIEAIHAFSNKIISNTIVPLILDLNYIVYPTNVKVRSTEDSLIRKHFLFASDESVCDNIQTIATTCVEHRSDSVCSSITDNEKCDNVVIVHQITAPVKYESTVHSGGVDELKRKPSLIPVNPVCPSFTQYEMNKSTHTFNSTVNPDIPMAVVTVSDDEENDDGESIDNVGTQVTIKRSVESAVLVPQTKLEPKIEQYEGVHDVNEVSKITESRMNLRQALKRARKIKQQPRVFYEEDNMIERKKAVEIASSKELEKVISYPIKPPSLIQISPKLTNTASTSSHKKEIKEAKLVEGQKKCGVHEKKQPYAPTAQQQSKFKTRKSCSKNNNKTANTAGAVNTSDTTSSSASDDSNSEQRQSFIWNHEPKEYPTHPEECGQEQFLRIFNLFTPVVLAQLQQRRSKRKRRTIHTTERADFHYGRLDTPMPVQTDITRKKKKVTTEFLLSPKVKRLQAKKGKRLSLEKLEDMHVSVSSGQKFNFITVGRRTRTPPLSPDAKLKCKECRKQNEPLYPCHVCDYMFHQDCHEDQGKPNPHIKCPTCVSNASIG